MAKPQATRRQAQEAVGAVCVDRSGDDAAAAEPPVVIFRMPLQGRERPHEFLWAMSPHSVWQSSKTIAYRASFGL